jgi:hypothetical protein
LNKVISNHSLKWGFLFTELLQNNKQNNALPTLTFGDVFSRADFSSPDTTGQSGSSIADALLGYPAFVSYTNPLSTSFADRYFALFLQDDWRVTKKLTLNIGLRWDAQSAPHERFNRGIVGFNPSAVSIGALANPCLVGMPPVNGCPAGDALGTNGGGGTYTGGVVFATPDNRSPYHNSFNNWGPRFGLAYQITNKLVFRGGWGRFYDYVGAYEFPPSTGFTSVSNAPLTSDGFQTPTLCSSTPGCVVPAGNPKAGLSANGYASLFPVGLSPITGSSFGAKTGAGSVITFMDPNFKPAYVNQFNAGFEYELPFQSVFHIEYNGSRSHNLIAGAATGTNVGSNGKSINQLTATQFVNQGNQLTSDSVPNPFANVLPGTAMNGPTIPAAQLDLPFPQYSDVIETDIPIGRAWYNSLIAGLEKRVTHGLTINVNYTWSKNMGATTWLNPNYDSFSNLLRAPTSIDQTQLLNILMSYQLPFFNHENNRFVKSILGGWVVSGNAQFQSGSLIAPFQTGTSDVGVPAGVFSTGLNPTKKNAAFAGQNEAGQWFNPCTIDPANDPNNSTGTQQLLHCGSGTAADAAWIIQTPFTLNKLNPFIDAMKFRRSPTSNLSIAKAFAITERVKFLIRADAYNLTNTPWFGWGDNGAGIEINPGAPTFGQIIPAQGNQPRTMQISGRITF